MPTPLILFHEPKFIEPLNVDWDWDYRNAIVKSLVPLNPTTVPHVRVWEFTNGYGVKAITSKELFLAGVIAFNLYPFIGTYPKSLFLITPYDKAALGLPDILNEKSMLPVEEVEEFLQQVKQLPIRRTAK